MAFTINVPEDYNTIQEGINNAVDGDTILVSEGEYFENLVLTKEIVLASNALNDNLDSLWDSNSSIINTIVNGFDPISGVSKSCLIIASGNIQPVIFGFTFTNGRGSNITEQACSPDSKVSGGAILIYKAYPTINYNRFIDNGTDPLNSVNVYEGGVIAHYESDEIDVEFDEDRNRLKTYNYSRTRPSYMDFQYNYYSNNAASSGLNIFSDFWNGTIDVNHSIFENIDCETESVNDYVLGTRVSTAFDQETIYGNCYELDTIYVSATEGNDANDGNMESPLKTITRALHYVQEEGSVIKVADGIYSPSTNGETFPLVIKNNTHLIGHSKGNTILDAQADSIKQRRVIEIYDGTLEDIADNILIENFTVTGGYHTDDPCIGGGGVLIGDPYNVAMTGIWVEPRPVLNNLRIMNNTSNEGGALFAYTEITFTIKNSEIIDNLQIGQANCSAAGIGLFSSYATIDRVLFKGNTNESGSEGDGEAISSLGYSYAVITNSTIVQNSIGIGHEYQYEGIFDLNIQNSIIYDNEHANFYSIPSANISYSNVEEGWDGAENIDTDPLFRDSDNDDFRLERNSPCIDAGTADLDGDGEEDIMDYNGASPDMGAFESGLFSPQGFQLIPQDTYVEITWNQVGEDNFQYYHLERSTDSEFSDNVVSHYITQNSYTDDELDYDTEYFYRLSYFAGDWSEYTDVLSVTLQWMNLSGGKQIPKSYSLHQNYPNPFNPVTKLSYDIPEDAMVNITIYNMMGSLVSTLVGAKQSAGTKSINWNSTDNFGQPVSAGIYLYTIRTGNFRQTKKMILLK